MNQETKSYEVSYLLSPRIPEDGVIKYVETIRSLIEKHGGLIENAPTPKLIRLAYPIKKETHGYFGYMQFLVAPQAVRDIHSGMQADESILRHLIIEWKKETAKQQAMMQKIFTKKDESSTADAPESGQKEAAEPSHANEQEIDEKLDELLGS